MCGVYKTLLDPGYLNCKKEITRTSFFARLKRAFKLVPRGGERRKRGEKEKDGKKEKERGGEE